jgi:hypothetical protein
MMDRQEAIAEQHRLFGDEPGWELPSICICLRHGVNGAADAWAPGDVQEALAMLRARLATWEEGPPQSRAVDDAVRALVEATIAEVEGYLRGGPVY